MPKKKQEENPLPVHPLIFLICGVIGISLGLGAFMTFAYMLLYINIDKYPPWSLKDVFIATSVASLILTSFYAIKGGWWKE
jgi:uncharacterized membrane protein YfcA